MILRTLLILMLVLQPLPLGSARGPASAQHECEPASCCVTIEHVSCCGERTLDRVCSMSGGACECASSSDDAPARSPEAPLPRTDRDSTLAVPLPGAWVVAFGRPTPLSGLFAGTDASLLSRRSHNEVRALLGVWRT